jgi:filamentous hemagglutinin family protein
MRNWLDRSFLFSMSFGAIGLLAERALAQSMIVPDETLGAERSVVLPLDANGFAVDAIAGGAQRGQNLFHSFREFNISAGRGAYFFSSNAAIQNILARVTGGNPSTILGTLGTFGQGTPDLFLINPNGIVFGPNASLDVQGSFAATTADGMGFGDRGTFSALAPTAPSPLLTINPSAFLVNQINAASIQNNSQVLGGLDSTGSDTFGLRVPDGRSLLLLGGNVSLDGGGIVALGGRVELGGVVGTGTIGLNINQNTLSLNFPDSVTRTNVSLVNGSGVNVNGEGGGTIQIQAAQLLMSGQSLVVANTVNKQGYFILYK